MWHRKGRTKTVGYGVLGVPFNRRCTVDDDSVEQLQHVVITEWDKLAYSGSLTASSMNDVNR